MEKELSPCRAWLYARIPGDYVGTMDSIKVCALQAHADGCTVVGSSTDEHGGWLLRPGYREMLRHIRKGEIDTVYICRIKTEDVSQFKEYAKQYGVLFAVIKDKSAQGEKVDIMFKAEDVSKLNRIYEQMGYNIPKAQGQTDRKKAPARNPQGPELRVPEKGSMTYDKRPSVRMKIDHYRAVAKAISETQKALQKGTKEAVTKEAR